MNNKEERHVEYARHGPLLLLFGLLD